MQFGRLADVPLDSTGLVCRQGRLMGLAVTASLSAVFLGAPVFWYLVQAPWFVSGLCAVMAVLIVPALLGDARSRFRPTNWLVWIRPGGIWINFRSYQDQGEDDTWAAVYIDYREIAAVRPFVETYTTPRRSGTTHWKVKSLEIRLRSEETSELAAALKQSRQRKQPRRMYLGFIGLTSRPTHYPISLPEPGVVRIAWRGGQTNWATPSLSRVLQELGRHVPVEEPGQLDRGDCRKLSPSEVDDQVLSLVQAGNKIAAAQLLVHCRGYSTTQAHQFVDELQSKA